MEELSLQFSSCLPYTKKQLETFIIKRFHDVVGIEIDLDPRKKGIKTLILKCDRCSVAGVFDYITNRLLLQNDRENLEKGVLKVSNQPVNPKTQAKTVETAEINQACSNLGKAFHHIFNETGNFANQVSSILSRIASLEATVLGEPAIMEKGKPAAKGLLSQITGLDDDLKAIRESIAAVQGEQHEIKKTLAKIEDHLADMPLYKK